MWSGQALGSIILSPLACLAYVLRLRPYTATFGQCCLDKRLVASFFARASCEVILEIEWRCGEAFVPSSPITECWSADSAGEQSHWRCWRHGVKSLRCHLLDRLEHRYVRVLVGWAMRRVTMQLPCIDKERRPTVCRGEATRSARRVNASQSLSCDQEDKPAWNCGDGR